MTMIEMDDGARLRTWTSGRPVREKLPVIMIHGGPGVPDYLEPVAAMIDDLCLVHRYDQRGTGGSDWDGEHTIGRHIRDLELLLDDWGHRRAVVIGHSFGTNLASYFLLDHPERVGGLIHLAGPFLDPWRDATRVTEHARLTDAQRARIEELEVRTPRTEHEEVEMLTLKWSTDHADRQRAWEWAAAAAQTQRPVNYVMNSQLNAHKLVEPLEERISDLKKRMPPGSMIIGGAGDPRPADVLQRVAADLGCIVRIIPDAGHNPWLEKPEEFRSTLRTAVAALTSAR